MSTTRSPPMRGVPISTRYSVTAASRLRTCSIRASSGLPNGTNARPTCRRSIDAEVLKKVSAAELAAAMLPSSAISTTGCGSASRSAAGRHVTPCRCVVAGSCRHPSAALPWRDFENADHRRPGRLDASRGARRPRQAGLGQPSRYQPSACARPARQRSGHSGRSLRDSAARRRRSPPLPVRSRARRPRPPWRSRQAATAGRRPRGRSSRRPRRTDRAPARHPRHRRCRH